MKLTKKFIAETATSELTQHEVNSFKWGNTPTEEIYLKSMIIKAKEVITIYHHEEGSKKVNEELVKWVNSCEDAKELDRKNMNALGIEYYA